MRIYIALLAATALTACGGSGPQTAGGIAATTGAGGTPVGGTTGTGQTASAHTFVVPTLVKTYPAQVASQTYTYDYTEAVETQKIKARDLDGSFLRTNTGDFVFTVTPQTYTVRDPITNEQILDPVTGRPTVITEIPPRRLEKAYQGTQLYEPFTSSVRSPGAQITYDPQNAQFTISIQQAGISENIKFQDPAHRTDFDGAVKPQAGVPNLEVGDPATWRTKGVQYLEVSNDTATQYDHSTFFYELPGTSTKYVTYAGFVRNQFAQPTATVTYDTAGYQYSDLKVHTKLERASMVFGENTPISDVPTTGTASFSGNMIATMVNNPEFDKTPDQSTYFQWIKGTANFTVDFAANSVKTTLAGTVLDPLIDTRAIRLPTDAIGFHTDQNGVVYSQAVIPAGAAFSATGAATIDLKGTGGFTGGFSAAKFDYAKNGAPTTANVDIVGGSIDGAFYGPKAAEIGASFRIVGGIPDQRVDIVGAMIGK